ncbi:hypothetical protein [Kitasatospora griseola]
MTSEEDFARALRASADHAPEPPTELFALAAERRGRTRVRRRRTAGASTLALVAAAGCALTLLPDRSPATPAPGTAPLGRASLPAILRSLLPTDGTVTEPQDTVPADPTLMTLLDYDDGHGPARVTVSLNRLATPIADATALQCPDTLAQPTTTCRSTTRPDGSRLVTAVTTPRWGGDRYWSVIYAAPDGRMVAAGESTDGAPGQPAREQPPVTPERLVAIATSDAWRPAFDTLPASTVPPAPPVDAAAVLAALRTALPAGATLDPGAEAQDTPGRARGTVSFAGRASQLTVTVEHGWQRGFPDDPATRFRNQSGGSSSYRQNPDGTRYFLQELQFPYPDVPQSTPGTQWITNALLPDGTMVTVKLWTYGPEYRITSEPGALDQQQLIDLATSPAWQHA